MSNWVWRSTEASREEGKISILAIIETFFFVLLTWGVAFYFNFYYYLFVPLVLTPFLMLKTPKSIELSHHLFLYEIDKNDFFYSALIYFVLIVSSVIAFLVISSLPEDIYRINMASQSYSIYSTLMVFLFLITVPFVWSVLMSGGKDIVNKTVNESIKEVKIISNFVKTVFIILGIFLIYNDVTLDNSMILFPIMLSMSLSNGIIGGFVLIIRSLLIKSFVTFRSMIVCPLYTISHLPANWREQVLVNDIFYTPELLPEIRKHNLDFQLIGLIHGNALLEDKLAKLFRYILAFFWFLAYLYRWSIKSTAWFYWPLAFVFNKKPLEDKTKSKMYIDDQTNPLAIKGHIVIGVSVAIYLIGSSISLDKLENFEPSVGIIIELFQSISIKYPFIKTIIHPETWWLVLSATVIYFIIYGFSSLQQHRRAHNNPEYSKTFNTTLHWFIRLKNVLWVAFFTINLFFIANEHVWPFIFRNLFNT